MCRCLSISCSLYLEHRLLYLSVRVSSFLSCLPTHDVTTDKDTATFYNTALKWLSPKSEI